MKRYVAAVAVLSILGLGFCLTQAFAETVGARNWHIYEVKQLLNYSVKNHEGETLGRMQDFVVDAGGRILFAVVSKPGFLGIRGEPVAVPFESLSFGDEKNELVLRVSRERFASAPRFDLKTGAENGAWAAEIYRYFGVQPYWTE
jgi:sporulation protein YlmC with PRC-barrel domain